MSSRSGSNRSGRGNFADYPDGYYEYENGYPEEREQRTDRRAALSSGRNAAGQQRRGSANSREPYRDNRTSGSRGHRRRRKGKHRSRVILAAAAVIIVAAVILMLIAVTDTVGSNEYTSSTIELLRNGKIRVTSVESFDQDYYDAEELEETIKDAISEYGDGVSQDYLDVSDGSAKLILTYDSAEDYVAFNGTDLFFGTVAEAEEAGYDFQSIMSAVSQEDTSKILTEATLDQLLENEVLILFEQADVVTWKDMLYATSNLGVTDSTHATAIDTISDETPAIVILVDD